MADETFDAAQRLRQREDFQGIHDRLRRRFVFHFETQHAAKSILLLFRERVTGIGFEAGIMYDPHPWVPVEESRDCERGLLLARYANRDRPQSTQREPRIEWRAGDARTVGP